MNDLLLRLRDKGNTVLVVEHKPQTIAIADHVIDLGPGAGTAGGTLLEGSVRGCEPAAPSPAAISTTGPPSRRKRGRPPAGWRSAARRRTTCATSTSTSRSGCLSSSPALPGRARLAHQWLGVRPGRRGDDRPGCDPRLAAQQPGDVHRPARPDPQRVREGQRRKRALFSANSEGACPNCNGAGVIYTDLAMMAGVATTCEECEGKRFDASVLDYHLGGRDISEVLAMPVSEAPKSSSVPGARRTRRRPRDRPGRRRLPHHQPPLTTLSGGERQRLKLGRPTWRSKGGIYALDEPTTGLPPSADVAQLLGLLDRPRRLPASRLIVIEHHPAVHGARRLDSSTLAPAPATTAAQIVFEGTPPADLVAAHSTLDRQAPRQ